MSTPLLIYSDTFLEHLTAGHPESPQRLKNILQVLDQHDLYSRLPREEPAEAERSLLVKLHHPAYIEHLETFCKTAGDGSRIDEDTVVSTHSFEAALKGAGAAVRMTEALVSGAYHTAFSLVRPPGHHAMPDHTMGFCLFNNVAIAATYALDRMGLKRILILDWDAHHGNATEHMFYSDPRVLFVSWHQYPNWPGTGAIEDMGEGAGFGYNLNIPMPVRYGDAEYLKTFRELVAPAIERFKPELILVSAGYDAHHSDLLTDMGITASGFASLTAEVLTLAEQYCEGRVGFVLEGGYNVTGLAWSVLGTLLTVLKEEAQTIAEPEIWTPLNHDHRALDFLIERIKKIHPLLQPEGA